MQKGIQFYFSKVANESSSKKKDVKDDNKIKNDAMINKKETVISSSTAILSKKEFGSTTFKRLRSIEDSDNENKKSHSDVKKLKNENDHIEPLKESHNSENKFLRNNNTLPKSFTTDSKKVEKSNNKSSNDQDELQVVIDDDIVNTESFDHFKLEFLKKSNLRDSMRRRPDDPLYDAASLYVPSEYMSKLTPGMRQWWQLKAKGFFDTLLFFKVGKFYELYHMDAVIAVNELNISYMRGSYAHCGFPEIAFTKMSDQLVQKGYKVARVEQTETVDAMTERCQGLTSKDKIIKREVCQIVTPGTRTFSLRNGTTRAITQEDKEDITFDDSVGAILYALKECPVEDASRRKSRLVIEIGVAVVNTNTGKFMLAQFEDDNQRSKLRTMMSRFPPNEIIYQKSDMSKDTQHLLDTTLASVNKEGLGGSKQFLSADDALQRLLEGNYFIDTPKGRLSTFGLPKGLSEVLNKGDNLGRTADSSYTLAVNSLGGLIYYLEKCLIDKYLISLADFVVYHPTDQYGCTHSTVNTHFYDVQSHMILDSNALQNLDLIKNGSTGGIEGTLLERLDFTSTQFGKRLLFQWIATPLCHPTAIADRQDAIVDLLELESRLGIVRQKLKSLPDLEKLLARIHSVGLIKSVSDHPDSRAVLYENVRYSRKKINDFIVTINAFKTIITIQSYFCDLNFERKLRSTLLKKLTLLRKDHEIGSFPDLESVVTYFQAAFNHEEAKKEGKIIPEKGVDQDYDVSIENINDIKRSLDKYLQEQRDIFGCTINYFGTGRNRFQLEIPESKCKNVPRTYVTSSQKKGFKRYETSETIRLLAEMMAAEDRRDLAMKNIMSRMFAKFDEHYQLWTSAIECLTQLDVLMSFSVFSRGVDGGPMVRPDVRPLTNDGKPFLAINEGRYPAKATTQTGEFISNSVKLGTSSGLDDRRVMILTGPNMGGKSTLMKQTALIIILAQLGCYVPAEGPVTLSPVDRLLTRQGANDAIGSGQSTLQVELNETASILTYMTAHSFLIIDELGRGTATHDGCALACSILTSIVDRCQPRTMFSTHFHKLLEEKTLTDKVQLCHMACMVEDDSEADQVTDIKLQNITFLYKLTSGSCPKSYGFNVARLANIPEKIILNGLKKSRLFEEETLILEFKRLLMGADRPSQELMKLWQLKFKKLYSW